MQTKTTGDLRRELYAQPDLGAYLDRNGPYFSHQGLSELLEAAYARCPFSKAALARRSDMSEIYVYQVFSGRRHPSRDRLLSLCVGMGAALDETQAILRAASFSELYPRLTRDAIIAHGIVHGAGLEQINNDLLTRGEPPLC